MEELTIKDFRIRQGQRFDLLLEGGAVPLVLTEVTSLGSSNPMPAAREPFSVFFDGTPGQCCQQGIYRLRNSQMGEFDLFIVPIARNKDDTYRYQALFA